MTIAAPDEREYRRRAFSIALGTGLASFAMNFWWPFLPLYLLEIGAADKGEALAWVAIATTGQGIARLVSGPAWGWLSDRVGRKIMFVRALGTATITTAIAGSATEPWMIVAALATQGFASGFIPAGVALTSVSVPDRLLPSALGMVTASQNIGRMAGPACGALLVALISFRGSIWFAAILPLVAAALVWIMVPKDTVGPRDGQADRPSLSGREGSLLGTQFLLAVFFYFLVFALTQMINLITPIEMERFLGDGATTAVGIAFTMSGIAGVVGAVVVARFVGHGGRLRRGLVILCAAAGLAHLLFLVVPAAWAFVAVFALISLLYGAMLPANNTAIAAAVPPERRGTAFGIAGSAQAVSFMVGPASAALYATLSFDVGYTVTAAMLLLMAGALWWLMVDPDFGRYNR